MSLTAVVLTLNEESNIAGCVDALAWTDQVIVLDSGSTDRTREIASDHGAKVIINRQPGRFNIAEQRNWALRHEAIEGDWVLFVDADEIYPESAQKAVRKAISYGRFDAYELTPKYMFSGRWMRRTMGYPNWHPRLIRRGHGRFGGGAWEHFVETKQVGRLSDPYLHYGNSKGLSDWLVRHDRYSDWEAESAVRYLEVRHESAFGTRRRTQRRALAARFWPLRPVARFGHMYFIRRGFLEGRAGFLFCIRYAVYEWMIVEKIVEQRRKISNLPL